MPTSFPYPARVTRNRVTLTEILTYHSLVGKLTMRIVKAIWQKALTAFIAVTDITIIILLTVFFFLVYCYSFKEDTRPNGLTLTAPETVNTK